MTESNRTYSKDRVKQNIYQRWSQTGHISMIESNRTYSKDRVKQSIYQ